MRWVFLESSATFPTNVEASSAFAFAQHAHETRRGFLEAKQRLGGRQRDFTALATKRAGEVWPRCKHARWPRPRRFRLCAVGDKSELRDEIRADGECNRRELQRLPNTLLRFRSLSKV